MGNVSGSEERGGMAVFADCLSRRETRTSIPTKTALTREGNSKKTLQRHLFTSYVHFFMELVINSY